MEALGKELEMRKEYFGVAPVLDSIYIGGGTPSLLSLTELDHLFEAICRAFPVATAAEITLEANPDDLTQEYLGGLCQTPVNRLSIGIQSFSEEDLRWMNRAHDAEEARRCIEYAMAKGFTNLTCDLIYGAPPTSDAQWDANIRILLDYGIPHLSCYCLTVEPKTALAHFVKTGQSTPVDDEKATRQFLYLMDVMEQAGYVHYEISNFAREGHYARHNTSYWLGEPYLGIGPGAHSYNGKARQWNLPNNARYLKYVEPAASWEALKGLIWDEEILTPKDCYNEYVMTGLRTVWGCKKIDIEAMGGDFFDYFSSQVIPLLKQGLVEEREGVYRLSRQGKLLADFISAELFFPV